jgi:hypothetical protein
MFVRLAGWMALLARFPQGDRPPVDARLALLIEQVARENPGWATSGSRPDYSNCAPGTGTMSRSAISFLLHPDWTPLKDHEVAVSPRADMPATGKPVTAGSATPYTTPVDVNRPPRGLVVAGIFVSAADGA